MSREHFYSNITFLHTGKYMLFVVNSFVVKSLLLTVLNFKLQKFLENNCLIKTFTKLNIYWLFQWTITIKFSSLKPIVWSLEGMFIPVVIAFLPAMQLESLKSLTQGFPPSPSIDILWSTEQYDGKKYPLSRYFKNDLKVKKNCLNAMLLKHFLFIF